MRLTLLLLTAAALPAAARAADPDPGAAAYDELIRPLLARHCLGCHGAGKPKADLRLDRLPPDFADPAHRDRWLAVLARVRSGEMPPKDKARLPAADVRALADWVGRQEAAARRAGGRVVLRRLNRAEYENTVRDLLGVHARLKDALPEDTPADGFDNVGSALHVSSFLLEKYLEAADRALGLAVANGPRPPLLKKRFRLADERQVRHATEKVYLARDDALVMFSSSAWNAITVGQFYPPDRGRYRVRISAAGHQSAGQPVTFRVDAGPMLMGTKSHLVGYFDAAPDRPTVIEFEDDLEARDHIRIAPYGLATAHVVNKVGADRYDGPGLAVQWVEVEGPLHDRWPPESHRRLFGDLPQAPAPTARRRLEVVSKDPEADADRVLRAFAGRAFRRAVTAADVRPFADLVHKKRAEGQSFEAALRVGLTAVLVSPDFLFLRERPGRLDDFALASRLSYFLWSTMPDGELLALAGEGRLGRPDVLRAQVERMLEHPKAAALAGNFVGQWLGLRDIDATEPSHVLYPEFDDFLKVSMVREAELFFAEVLREDLSLTHFVASDFSMLNGRLATHYGIPGVDGNAFRKVTLPADSHRGGVLTMAGVLKVTANGTTTSPVLRGAWVLDRVLGTPPPRPPADLPAVEPDIRGATTIREQLAKHRNDPSCASCHVRIDPPGFALESFDVIGGWRDHYRATGRGQPVTVAGRRMPYLKGPKVDPTGVLADGRPFRDVDEFKRLLAGEADQVARALAVRLVTYATGAAPTEADRAELDALLGRVRTKGYGLRTLVHEVVQSALFRNK